MRRWTIVWLGFLIFISITRICMFKLHRTLVVRILSFSVYLANPSTSISKFASIASRTDNMRLAAGWDSLFDSNVAYTRIHWTNLNFHVSSFRLYHPPHTGCQPGHLTMAHNANLSLHLTLVRHLVASHTGQFNCNNLVERSWLPE